MAPTKQLGLYCRPSALIGAIFGILVGILVTLEDWLERGLAESIPGTKFSPYDNFSGNHVESIVIGALALRLGPVILLILLFEIIHKYAGAFFLRPGAVESRKQREAFLFGFCCVWLAFAFFCQVRNMKEYGGHIRSTRSHEWWDLFSTMLGLMSASPIALILLPTARFATVLNQFGISHEHAVSIHRVIGVVLAVIIFAHSIMYLVIWAAIGTLGEAGRWQRNGVNYLAGVISTLAFAVLLVLLIPAVWRQRGHYRLFYITHIILSVLFIVFGVMHYWLIWTYILPPVVVMSVDSIYRTQRQPIVQAQTSKSHDLITIKVAPPPNLPHADFAANTGRLSHGKQRRPFSVSGVYQHIRKRGPWTSMLHQNLSSLSSDSKMPTDMKEEIPTGGIAPKSLAIDAQVIAFVAGTGITPVVSAADAALRQNAFPQSSLALPTVVWSVATQAEAMSVVACHTEAFRALAPKMHVYLTKETEESVGGNIEIPPTPKDDKARASAQISVPPYWLSILVTAIVTTAAAYAAQAGFYERAERVHEESAALIDQDWFRGFLMLLTLVGFSLLGACITFLGNTCLQRILMRIKPGNNDNNGTDKDSESSDAQEEAEEVSPASLLVHHGRPDMDSHVANHAKGVDVGLVLGGGPPSFLDGVKASAHAHGLDYDPITFLF